MTATVIDDRDSNEEFDNAFDEFSSGINTEQEQRPDTDDAIDEMDSSEDAAEEEVVSEGPDELTQLRQQLEQIKQERDHFEHSFKSQVGRVSALQKKIDGEKKDDTQTEQDDADEEIKSVLADYPEIAGPIIKAIEKKYGAIKQEVDNRFAPIQQQETQRYIDSQTALLDQHLPDWRETVSSDEYNQWLQQQPPAVQGMADSIHAQDYAYLVNAFKAAHPKAEDVQQQQANELADKRRQKMAANVTVQSKGQSKKSVAPDDFDKAWDYYASKLG
jgi:hypothetical protein